MAGQVEADEEAEVDAFGGRDLVAEMLAFARVAVEEIVDAGQALKVPGGGQKEHGVAGAYGDEQTQEGVDEEAVSLLQRALAADPDRVEVYYHLGQALLRRGETVRGRQRLDYFHSLQQEHQKLLAHKTAVVLNPNDADAYYKLGAVYARIGRYEAASQAYQAALAVAPDHLDARNNLGNIYLRRRALGLAIAAYQEVLRRDPHYARAYYNLGNAYLLAGEETRAMAAFAKAVEADPEHRKAQQMLAELRRREAQGER